MRRLKEKVVFLLLAVALAMPAAAHVPPVEIAPAIDLSTEPTAQELVQSLPVFAGVDAFEDVARVDLPPVSIADELAQRFAVGDVESPSHLSIFERTVSRKLASGPLAAFDEDNLKAESELGPKLRTSIAYVRNRWYEPGTGTFLSPDPAGYADSSNLYAFCGGDPVNCKDPTGEIGLRAALTDGIINSYEMETLELTDQEIRTIIGSQSALKYAGPEDPNAKKHNLTRAKFILLTRNPAFKAYTGQLYQLTRGLNPVHFAAEVGWAIGSGEEPIMQEKISRRDKALELATYLLFLKGGEWITGRLSAIRARAVGGDGFEPVHGPMQDRLTPHEKKLLGENWSREAAISRGGTILGEEVELVFTINGRRVTVRADFVVREADGTITYIESKFSPGASYQPNQTIVYPELVKAGDAGLVAEVGSRSGGGQLIPGQKIRVRFQGDVWNGAGKIHGQ